MIIVHQTIESCRDCKEPYEQTIKQSTEAKPQTGILKTEENQGPGESDSGSGRTSAGLGVRFRCGHELATGDS